MISDSIRSSIDHVSRTNERMDRLAIARDGAVEQVIHRIAQEYAAGALTTTDLLAVRDQLIGSRGRWNTCWNKAGLPSRAMLNSILANSPNGPSGSWYGTEAYPTADDPMPPNGVSVVYVLYDAANLPCYVGSTENFRSRLRSHTRDGKPVKYWTAFPCPDRESAYRLEYDLLGTHKPYLNGQTRDRRWSASTSSADDPIRTA